ncbi:hypothetical protein BC940DRAFT_256383 [Gongronella butleri]|nr:hypothetical protein BC940DRAFT_256383 [Gongronella butleri]
MIHTEADNQTFRRRIVLCMDGTWDTPTDTTNIYRWYQHVDMSPHEYKGDQWVQLPGYFPGVGTYDKNQDKNLIEGAFGLGIEHQILDAYRFLATTLQDVDRDEVWVIGFSRGAYAARCLVGMLYNVGLLPEDHLTPNQVKEAYHFYRARSADTSPESDAAVQFRKEHQCVDPIIGFLGCFDTVGDLGVPPLPFYLGGSLWHNLFRRCFRFHDTNISPWVRSAFHALAIHEQRRWYEPTLMSFAVKPKYDQELVQKWFPGMHSDVGGAKGYEDLALPNHALLWMMLAAQERGFEFTKTPETICAGDKYVYHDSYTSSIIYRMIPRKDRVIDTRIFAPEGMRAIYSEATFPYIPKQDLERYPSHTLDRYEKYVQTHPSSSSP